MRRDITGRAAFRASRTISNVITRFRQEIMPLGPASAELSSGEARHTISAMSGEERVELSRLIGEERMLELMRNGRQ